MKRILLLLYLWICWGFALGAFVLLVPVRKTVDYARATGWSATQENIAVYTYIVLLAAISLIIALYSRHRLLKHTGAGTKFVLAGIPLILAGVALYLFLHPGIINVDNSKSTNVGTQFTIGPYPDEEKVKDLKSQGYTAIITLLHPAVVPFEPKLINEEIACAKSANIAVIQIPMLPWVSDNAEAADSLRRLVRNGKGRYYVHCYLGKDRVNAARRIIEQEQDKALLLEPGLLHRSLNDLKSFERGQIYRLDSNTWFTPMPTKEEYFGYIIASNLKQVVSLTDKSDREGVQTMLQEERWVTPYKIPYKAYDLSDASTDQAIVAVVDSVKKLPRPLLIHAYRTDLKVAIRFIEKYKAHQ